MSETTSFTTSMRASGNSARGRRIRLKRERQTKIRSAVRIFSELENVKVKKVASVIKKGMLPNVKLTSAQSLPILLRISTSVFLILLIDSMNGCSQA